MLYSCIYDISCNYINIYIYNTLQWLKGIRVDRLTPLYPMISNTQNLPSLPWLKNMGAFIKLWISCGWGSPRVSRPSRDGKKMPTNMAAQLRERVNSCKFKFLPPLEINFPPHPYVQLQHVFFCLKG